MTARLEQFSNWGRPPADLQPSLQDHITADVAIIGGGFTGLSAARALRAQGASVVLLEAEFCGAGASGRNAGHLTPTVGRDIATCLKLFGKEKGLALARFSDESVEHVEQTIHDLNIDCDYEPVGNVIAGVHEAQRSRLQDAAATAAAAGIKMRFMDEAEIGQAGLPGAFKFGIKEDVGGVLNPLKLANGLRRAALDEGVQIFEASPVTGLKETDPAIVSTAGGQVTAHQVLIATNAYTGPSLGREKSRGFPLRVTQFRTEPLSDEQVERLGWRSRSGIYTGHRSLENFRLTADNRITGGSKWVQYQYGAGLAPAEQPETFAAYEQLLPVRFPEIPEIRIDQFWGGWICMTLDTLPVYRVSGRRQNIHTCFAYNGHGIAHANKMGQLAGLAMAGHASADLDLFNRRMLPLPPEPFKWMAVQFELARAMRPDRKVDEEIAAGRR